MEKLFLYTYIAAEAISAAGGAVLVAERCIHVAQWKTCSGTVAE